MKLTFPNDVVEEPIQEVESPTRKTGPNKSLRMKPPKGEIRKYKKEKNQKSKVKAEVRRHKKVFKKPKSVAKDLDERRAVNSFFDGSTIQLFTQMFLYWLTPAALGVYVIEVMNVDWLYILILGVVYTPVAINKLFTWVASRTVVTGTRHKYIGGYKGLLIKVIFYTIISYGVVALNGLVLTSQLPEGLLFILPLLINAGFGLWIIVGLIRWKINNTIQVR